MKSSKTVPSHASPGRMVRLLTIGGALLLSWANPLSAQDIYWTSQQTIWGGNLDGSEIREIFNGTTSTPLMAGNAVDVAATATHIYWTDNGDPGNPAESKIWRAERNGDNPVVLVQPDPQFTAPQFLQIDEANNKIYFTCWANGLFSANLDDGSDLTFIAKPTINHAGIALRGANEMLLVAPAADDRNIYAIDLTATDNFYIAGVYDGHIASYGIEFDPNSGLAYLSTFNDNKVFSFNFDTFAQQPIVEDGARPLGISLSPSGTHLAYASRNAGAVMIVELATNESTFFAGGGHFGVELVADPEPSVPSNIISTDNFEAPHVAGLPPVLRPLSPWNNVQQGDTRGLITIVQDADNLFGEGTENQVVEFRKIDPSGATGDGNVTLQSTNMFPIGEGPRVITFSMDFLELEESPFNNSQRLAIRSYYTANFGTQLDQLDFRDIRQADLYEKGKPYRLDYILNASLEPITYSRIDGTGSWTLESGKAHIWVYDPKKGTGTEPVTSLPTNDLSLNAAEPFVGFTFTTFTDTSALMQIDNFTVYDGALVSTGEVVVEGGFAAWQAEHFDAEELADLEISGPEANPAGDGIPNLLKYALGLDPHVSSRDALPVSEIAEGELILVYTRPAGIEDVTYTVEVSNDLVNWVSGEEHVEVTVVENTEDQTETVTVWAIGYPGANEQGFLRLKVDSQ